MKKLLAAVIFLTGILFCANAEQISKEEDIDNIYSIEWTLDTDTGNTEIRLFAVNSDAYDESFGNDCINEELSGIMSDYGYSESSLLSTDKDDNYKDKYTKIVKKYSLK